jgi:hypothetical protein
MILRVEKQQALARGAVGYRLSNGWTLITARDRADYGNGHKFSVWAPGRRACGFSFVCGAATIEEALALASARQDAADSALARMAFGKEYR